MSGSKRNRPPQITKLHRFGGNYGDKNSYSHLICFTAHQAKKLPHWVRAVMNMTYAPFGNVKWVAIRVIAKDELEASMRFNRLWESLPKEGA